MSFVQVQNSDLLSVQGLNRGYDPVQLITWFIISVSCGANRYEHLEVTRFDGVILQVRSFQKFSMANRI